MGCGLLVGPPAVPKRPQCGAAWHLPGVLTAPSEPTLKVLCSVCWFLFPRHKKGLFPHAQVLFIGSVLMQLFLWNWAFSLPRQRLWFISNLRPEVASSSFPPETFLLLAIWFQLLWRPYTMQLSRAWQSKEGHPEPRRERHTSAQMVVGNQDPSCAV